MTFGVRRHCAPRQQKIGIIQSAPYEGGKTVEGELIQCCHCQWTQLYTPGVEKQWGLCYRCADWHCSKFTCRTKCVSVQRWLENRRTGKPDDYSPIWARVEAEPPRSPGGVILGEK